jgi:hypothetical protein
LFHADGQKDGRTDEQTDRCDTGVTKLNLFYAILRTSLKFGSNFPTLHISVVRDIVSLETRLAFSKEPKKLLRFLFTLAKKQLFAVRGARFKIRRICLLSTQCVYMRVMIL